VSGDLTAPELHGSLYFKPRRQHKAKPPGVMPQWRVGSADIAGTACIACIAVELAMQRHRRVRRKEIATCIPSCHTVNTCNPQALSAVCQHSFRLSQGTGHNLAMLESKPVPFLLTARGLQT
jgi:hypothetical protein